MYLMTLCVLILAACGKSEKYTIEILIPAGSTADFVYSDTEICPTGNKITISSGAGLGDTEVTLKPVEVKQKTAYEPEYLTRGMPVKMDVEKGGWFKLGVSVQNDSDRGPIAVSVEVEGVEVRIAERDEVTFEATVLEVHDGYYLVNPVEGSRELNSADKIEVSMKNLDPSLEPEVGDIIEITYDGIIMETYPARLHEVYSVRVVREAENTDDAPLAPPAEPGDEGNDELPDRDPTETIAFHDKTFSKSDLSKETIEWLEWYNGLAEDEQLAISYVPSDLYEICGYPTAEDMAVEETITYNGKEYKTSELCNG